MNPSDIFNNVEEMQGINVGELLEKDLRNLRLYDGIQSIIIGHMKKQGKVCLTSIAPFYIDLTPKAQENVKRLVIDNLKHLCDCCSREEFFNNPVEIAEQTLTETLFRNYKVVLWSKQ